MNKVKDKLPALVEEELAAAMEEHGSFASAHEGYAVLLEEVEEAEAELLALRALVADLWQGVKRDNAEGIWGAAEWIAQYAVNLAAEAVQVSAMAWKIMGSLDTEKVTP